MNQQTIEAYWQDYLVKKAEIDQPYLVDQFGDHPQLADEIVHLVLAGVKTATCSALWEWEAEGRPLPHVGLKTIFLDGNNRPCCIVETIEVNICRFSQVDAQFAYDEGEDDRTLESWKREHWRYFSRTLPKINQQPCLDMPLVCERFRVVYQHYQYAGRMLC